MQGSGVFRARPAVRTPAPAGDLGFWHQRKLSLSLIGPGRRCLGVPSARYGLAVRLFYLDDSGNEAVTIFSAVAVPVEAWTAALDVWLGWRRHLRAVHGIDVRSRLHAADWLAGRGRPSDDPGAVINRSKPVRWREFVSALDAVAAMPGVEVMTSFASGDRHKPPYRALMHWIDLRLREADDHGLIVLDGESGELRTMHRELDIATRRIVEDHGRAMRGRANGRRSRISSHTRRSRRSCAHRTGRSCGSGISSGSERSSFVTGEADTASGALDERRAVLRRPFAKPSKTEFPPIPAARPCVKQFSTVPVRV